MTIESQKKLVYQMEKAQGEAPRIAVKIERAARQAGQPIRKTKIRYAVKVRPQRPAALGG